MTAPRKTTKADVDLARLTLSHQRWMFALRGGCWLLALPLSVLPIWMFKGVVEPFAGTTTVVNLSIVASITVTISIAINVAQWGKLRMQRTTINRLRERIQRYEPDYTE